jgi:hypothetical protein
MKGSVRATKLIVSGLAEGIRKIRIFLFTLLASKV